MFLICLCVRRIGEWLVMGMRGWVGVFGFLANEDVGCFFRFGCFFIEVEIFMRVLEVIKMIFLD